MTKSQSEKVTVSILNRPFEVACLPDEKVALIKAATLLDNKMRALRNQGAGNSSFDRLLVVVALNLCNESMSSNGTTNTTPHPQQQIPFDEEDNSSETPVSITNSTLNRLIEKIETALDENTH